MQPVPSTVGACVPYGCSLRHLRLQVLALLEVDRLLDLGFESQLRRLLLQVRPHRLNSRALGRQPRTPEAAASSGKHQGGSRSCWSGRVAVSCTATALRTAAALCTHGCGCCYRCRTVCHRRSSGRHCWAVPCCRQTCSVDCPSSRVQISSRCVSRADLARAATAPYPCSYCPVSLLRLPLTLALPPLTPAATASYR